MDAADVLADLSQRLDRLARPVEDHVGRIEVDEQVVALHVADELQQRVGRFLSGFQVQRLTVLLGVIAQVARDGDDLLIERLAGVVRHEAQVQGDDRAAEQLGEVGDLLHLRQSRRARFRRHEAHGAVDRGNVGVAFALEAAEDGGQRECRSP